jgi:nucleoside-diphosphate-sugar epimerase
MNKKTRNDLQTIAILGATGHIAKSIINSFNDESSFLLHLFSRSIEKTASFINEHGINNAYNNIYSQFNEFEYSSIINCTGVGDPSILRSHPTEVFLITEEVDLLVINYLKKYTQTTYINFSSGAIYGSEFNTSVNRESQTTLAMNSLKLSDYYGIAKINAEAKHRSLNDYNIIDLRIFGYYSRFIDLTKNYLMTDILSSIRENRTLITRPTDIIRDYIHPKDLSELVKACLKAKKVNEALDVRSKKPVSKMEILDFFKQNYELEFEIIEEDIGHSATGEKLNYYSENNNTKIINFHPKYSSIECIALETEELLKILNN